MGKSKKVSILITLDKDVLQLLDDHCKKIGGKRSTVIEVLIMENIPYTVLGGSL